MTMASDEEDRIAWPPPGYRTGDDVLDAPVQATHLDAAGAKKVCADLGYFEDKLLKNMVPAYMCQRKSPMIHRGYYVRTLAMRRAAEFFIRGADPTLPLQIVDLGSGLDTLYWYVMENIEKWGRSKTDLVFYEIDFPVVIAKKTRTIRQKGLVEDAEKCVVNSSVHHIAQLKTPSYRLLACDMRQPQEFHEALHESGFNGMGNALFLSECVLVYMQPAFADRVILTCKNLCLNPNALQQFVVYEQCNPHTPFGRQMVRNLRTRGCALLGLDEYRTIPEQEARYKKLGFDNTCAYTLNEHYDRTTTDAEKERLSKLEILDELEEFQLIQDHYFILVACNQKYDPTVIF